MNIRQRARVYRDATNRVPSRFPGFRRLSLEIALLLFGLIAPQPDLHAIPPTTGAAPTHSAALGRIAVQIAGETALAELPAATVQSAVANAFDAAAATGEPLSSLAATVLHSALTADSTRVILEVTVQVRADDDQQELTERGVLDLQMLLAPTQLEPALSGLVRSVAQKMAQRWAQQRQDRIQIPLFRWGAGAQLGGPLLAGVSVQYWLTAQGQLQVVVQPLVPGGGLAMIYKRLLWNKAPVQLMGGGGAAWVSRDRNWIGLVDGDRTVIYADAAYAIAMLELAVGLGGDARHRLAVSGHLHGGLLSPADPVEGAVLLRPFFGLSYHLGW